MFDASRQGTAKITTVAKTATTATTANHYDNTLNQSFSLHPCNETTKSVAMTTTRANMTKIRLMEGLNETTTTTTTATKTTTTTTAVATSTTTQSEKTRSGRNSLN